MSISDFFRFGSHYTQQISELPEIFPFSLNENYFVKADILSLFKKIFTDCVERTYGISENDQHALWDNCLESEASKGLITHLSEAMYNKNDLFLVYKEDVLRLATQEEITAIKEDYKSQGTSTIGVYISFKNFDIADLLKIYSSMEYCVLASLHKSMNLSKAIQMKIGDLRKSISEFDKDLAVNQAKAIAQGLGQGKDIIIDALDEIVTSKPDMDSTQKAIEFINQKKAFILSLPQAYITGEQTGGIGASGEQDMRAVERGLKNYYVSILKPVIKALFDTETSFKSQDFRLITNGLEAIKTFELVSDSYLSAEEKKEITKKLFNLEINDSI